MLGLDELVAAHKDDQPGKPLFTAYTAAVPVHRLRVGLLVTEAVDLDPVELFLLEGVRAGLRSPRELALFFGLEQDIVDISIGDMLHNSWLAAGTPQPGTLVLSVTPKGQEVLKDKQARVDAVRETEVWVDGLLKTCEVRPLGKRLLRPIDAKNQGLHRLPTVVQAPRQTADLDFAQLERSVAQNGSQLWPGVQVALLLDLLTVTRRGTGYRTVDVLVFQNEQATEVDFNVYDVGARHDGYERVLRRLDAQESQSVIPTETPPPAAELMAFEREAAHVVSLLSATQEDRNILPGPKAGADPATPSIPPSESAVPQSSPAVSADNAAAAGDTRERLRGELAAAQGQLRDKEAVVAEQARIIDQQKLFRNQENRVAWKRVLIDEAQRYVVMEFPWITREAIDSEMLQCFHSALDRRVKLWIAWGLDEQGPAGGRPADPAVLRDISELQKQYGARAIRMQRRGNTHRKVLLWDARAAIIGSFNWGSFRGDPRRRVREEIGAQVTTPREVADLESEYKRIFTTSSLA